MGSSSVRVAVLDEGVDLDHPEIKTRISDSWDAVKNPKRASPQDGADHGTACAGIIAATYHNRIGIAGVAPGVRLISVRIAERNDNGGWSTSPEIIAAGIRKAVDLHADVLSGSWGIPGTPLDDITSAVTYAYTRGRGGKGTIPVFAAGNTKLLEGSSQIEGDAVHFPATMASTSPVIAVGASTPCDELKTRDSCDNERFWASNRGNEITLLAPGVKMPTLTNRAVDPQYPYNLCFRGTSSATPLVAGVVALMLSLDRFKDLPAAEIKRLLAESSDTLGASGKGYRRLNACRAVGGEQCASAPPSQ
jgi:subtilisin family serine protease